MNIRIKSVKAGLQVAAFFALAAGLSSCSTGGDPISAEVAQTATNEATVSSQTSEVDDIATTQLNSNDLAPGRYEATQDDDRVKCATITKTTSTDKSSGTIVIDFGTGCTDSKGNVRKGKITVNWSGTHWYLAGATHTLTFTGYSINDVKFSDNDIRTVTNVSSASSPLTFKIEATHNLTWPDATTASRTVHHTRQWVRTATVVDDKIIISQTAGATNASSGTNRHNKSYTIQISVPLEYSRACATSNKVFKPVKGVLIVTYDTNKTVTIDYGTGTCDNSYTISTGGHTKTISAKNDSSAD